MRIPFRFLSTCAGVLATVTLTACVAPAPAYQATSYPYPQQQPYRQQQPYPQQQPYAAAPSPYVEYGRVANIEVLQGTTAGTGTTGGGAVAGGVVGGLVGNRFGGGNGRVAATALGIVGGALLGNSIEASRNGPRASESYRVSIQTDGGGYRSFDVSSPGDLHIGDRVRIDNGQISRY